MNVETKNDEIVGIMKEFDWGLPDELREKIVTDEGNYGDYKKIMERLDELYFNIDDENEDVKEIKIEIMKALEDFSRKYNIDMTAIEKMLM